MKAKPKKPRHQTKTNAYFKDKEALQNIATEPKAFQPF